MHLENYQQTQGASFLLNFETGSCEEVDQLVVQAVSSGARLVKDSYETSYGWYQAVLTDPEGNVFRINHILTPVPPPPSLA